MSASQDKKRRAAERAAGESPKTLAEREAAAKARKEKTKWTVTGAIIAVFIVLILILNSGLLYTGTTAVTIGDYKFTNAEYQYYYTTLVNNLYSSYGSYLSLFGLDVEQDFDEQALDSSVLSMMGLSLPESLSDRAESGELTWDDYFRETALQNMREVTALWDAAVAEGYTLSEEDSASIDEIIDTYASLAEQSNLRGADGYIALAFGKGVDSGVVRELLERAYIAEDYSGDVYDSFEYTGDELAAYYGENAGFFDALSFDYYFVAAETEEVTETVTDEETGEESEETSNEVTDATMAEAKEKAEQLLSAAQNGEEAQAMSFAEAVAEVIGEDAEPTEARNSLAGNVSGSYIDPVSDWLLDSGRAAGDMDVIESEGSGYYVLHFISRSDNSDYNGRAFRHILINVVDEDEDGEFSEEEIQAAEDKLQEIYDEWKDGDATEESFAELANANSEDSGSNGSSAGGGEGGLCEHVGKNQMVDPVNDWLFDESREAGDTEMVYSESGSYTGWHLLYYVGEDGYSYHDCLAQYGMSSSINADAPQGLRAQDYEAWQEELLEPYTVSVNAFVNWFAKV